MWVIVKHHLVQVGRIDGPTEYLSWILAASRSPLVKGESPRLVAQSWVWPARQSWHVGYVKSKHVKTKRIRPKSPVGPPFRALSGRFEFAIRRHKINKYGLFVNRSKESLRGSRQASKPWGGASLKVRAHTHIHTHTHTHTHTHFSVSLSLPPSIPPSHTHSVSLSHTLSLTRSLPLLHTVAVCGLFQSESNRDCESRHFLRGNGRFRRPIRGNCFTPWAGGTLMVTASQGFLACLVFPRKADVRLPWQGNSNSHGARPVHPIITVINWIQTSRLSRTKSLALVFHLISCSTSKPRMRLTPFVLERIQKMVFGSIWKENWIEIFLAMKFTT